MTAGRRWPGGGRPRAGARRRVAAALGLIPLGALAALGWAPPAAGAAPTRPAGTVAPPAAAVAPTLTLLSQPTSVGPDDPFSVFIRVSGAPAGADLAVDIYDRLTDPAQVGQVPTDAAATFGPVALAPVGAPAAALPQSAGFTIQLYRHGEDRPAGDWAYRLDQAGVYPLRVRLRYPGNHTIATLYTQLVRLPDSSETVHQAQVALVPRVHQDPPADPATRAAASAVDPAWARKLDALLELLRSHPKLAASFSVTPDTAYRLVRDDRDATVLADLRAEVGRSSRELLDAPYVEIDPASLVASSQSAEVDRQEDLGQRTLRELLAAPSAGTWWLGRALDARTLGVLRARGIRRLVVPASTLGAGSTAVPAAPVDLAAGSDSVQAMAIDPATTPEAGTSADPVLAANRLLARIAATADTASTDPGIVVPLDPATLDPRVAAIVLRGLDGANAFARATTVDDLFDQVSASPATPTLAAPQPVDLGDYPATADHVRTDLASYTSMLVTDSGPGSTFDRTLAVSAAAGLALHQRLADLERVDATLQRRFQGVSTPARDKVTLGARDARFPLIVTSTLTYPVRVVIEVSANDRLSFPQDRIERTIPTGRTVTQIRVRTLASGDTPVRITVRSPDDGVTLAQSQYTIRSTAVSSVGLVLSFGAAAFLAVWWARNWYRSRQVPKHARKRRRGHAPGAAV